MRHASALCLASISIAAVIAANACGGNHSPGSNGCPGLQDLCGTTCTDTQTDPANCGSCGGACAVTAPFCQAGACVAMCGSGFDACGGGCVDTANDPTNCGRCGRDCAINETCTAGQCVPGACRGTTCGSACVDTTSDPTNCGACGTACAVTSPLCVMGKCQAQCPPGLVLCGTQCVDVSKDPNHCGSCGNQCDTGVCASGHCGCGAGEISCGLAGGCVNVMTDPDHCGSCQMQCNGSQLCTNSACECRPGLTKTAGGACIDPNTDPAACGTGATMCGNTTPDCQGGHCVAACTGNTMSCGGACVDVQNDPQHCGDCGTQCDPSQVCAAGQCRDFRQAPACTTCPCNDCNNGGGGRMCCPYPGDPSLIVCVDGGVCPAT
jgi:hypothetical protein